jgi:hypothetical protein
MTNRRQLSRRRWRRTGQLRRAAGQTRDNRENRHLGNRLGSAQAVALQKPEEPRVVT